MSETAINDYLTKQITVNKNIVTFRLLSRALSIHVNAAKLALEKFHDAAKSVPDMRIHATFFLSGDAPPTRYGDENPMETDTQESVLEGPSALAESVSVRQFLIVPEENLESAKRKFTKLDDIHYYSLAPSPIRDPALLVTATDAVRKMDSTRTPQDLQKLGVAVDLTIKVNQNIKARLKPPAGPTVPSSTADGSKPGPSKVKDEPLKAKPVPKPEQSKPMWPPKKDAPLEVPKAKGVLNWSKAKPKGAGPAKSIEPGKAKELVKVKEKETKPAALARPKPLDITITDKGKRKITALMDLDDEEEDEPLQRPLKVEPEPKIEPKELVIDRSANAKVGPPKRGIKRPPSPLDDEDEAAIQPPKNRPRLSAPEAPVHARNGRILSDEEDSEPVVKKKRIQRRTKSEIAMLWSDDDAEVIKARRSSTPEKRPPTRETSPEPTADEGEDAEMQDQEDISLEEEPVQKRPKRIKEEWPVGRNGLRKRRIEKEKMSTDDKGYTAVETYSEYESITSESEEPSVEEVKKAGRKVKAAKKGKGKEKTPKPLAEEEPAVESSEMTTNPRSASRRDAPKEEERKHASAPALPKSGKSAPAGKNGQKTLNSFFGKK